MHTVRTYIHKHKEKLGILSLIGDLEIKVKKQGKLPIPADILVDI